MVLDPTVINPATLRGLSPDTLVQIAGGGAIELPSGIRVQRSQMVMGGPGTKEYQARIPPPADEVVIAAPPDLADKLGAQPDMPVTVQNAGGVPTAAPIPSPISQQRVVVSFGPKEGKVVVAIEQGKDWDIDEDASWILDARTVVAMLPVLRKLTKIRDLTGGTLQAMAMGGEE